MHLPLEPYQAQLARWPTSGRRILAAHDDLSVTVYQAFRPDIVDAAVRAGRFAEGFSRSRMSWIKPGFLWMMYRSGWASKESQERVVAVRLAREGFFEILRRAVPSRPVPGVHADEAAWKAAMAASDVRLQWDPDHTPHGAPCDRRAIQLGLRSRALLSYVDVWTLSITDVTPFVHEQRARLEKDGVEALVLPRETVLEVPDAAIARGIELDGGA